MSTLHEKLNSIEKCIAIAERITPRSEFRVADKVALKDIPQRLSNPVSVHLPEEQLEKLHFAHCMDSAIELVDALDGVPPDCLWPIDWKQFAWEVRGGSFTRQQIQKIIEEMRFAMRRIKFESARSSPSQAVESQTATNCGTHHWGDNTLTIPDFKATNQGNDQRIVNTQEITKTSAAANCRAVQCDGDTPDSSNANIKENSLHTPVQQSLTPPDPVAEWAHRTLKGIQCKLVTLLCKRDIPLNELLLQFDWTSNDNFNSAKNVVNKKLKKAENELGRIRLSRHDNTARLCRSKIEQK